MCEYKEDCPNAGTRVVGELVVCDDCAPVARNRAHHVADEFGQVLCFCGYYKPKGTECGEPCL